MLANTPVRDQARNSLAPSNTAETLFGNCRHWQPVDAIYRIAFTTIAVPFRVGDRAARPTEAAVGSAPIPHPSNCLRIATRPGDTSAG